MSTISEQIAEAVEDFFTENTPLDPTVVTYFTHYIGRGMFGDSGCFALAGDVNHIMFHLGEMAGLIEHGHIEDTAGFLDHDWPNYRLDQWGHEGLIYWPSIPYKEKVT